MILRARQLYYDMLSVGYADGWAGLRLSIRPTYDALVIDACRLDDDVAQHVCRLHDRMVIGRGFAGLDGPPQVQQGLVDFTDRAEHVLLEHHRKVAICSLGFFSVGLDI